MVYTCGSCPVWLICRRPLQYRQSQSASLPVFFFCWLIKLRHHPNRFRGVAFSLLFLLVKKQLLEATGWWWSSGHPFQINGGINNSSESIFNYEILLSILYNIICELYVIIKRSQRARHIMNVINISFSRGRRRRPLLLPFFRHPLLLYDSRRRREEDWKAQKKRKKKKRKSGRARRHIYNPGTIGI